MDEREQYIRTRVKHELRRRMKALRKAFPEQARQKRSGKIAERVLSLEEMKSVKSLAAFVSTRGEVDPRRIVEHCWDTGVEVSLPRVDFERGEIVLHRVQRGDPLEPGGFGIPEPSEDSPVVALDNIDFVLVPGLAVDPQGHRVGYGKGFYDRLLPRLPNAIHCCVAFHFQLIAEAPATAHDVPVHLVCTDEQLIRV